MEYLKGEEMIGHDYLRDFLWRSVKNKRHHAFLFSGAEHLGKDTVARAFVADVLGRPIKDWATLSAHPDVAVISRADDEKNIGINLVRGFINHFSSSSFWGGYKIGIVSGAHELSLEASNALLKTLEEPASNALLILIAHDISRLPETIKSRCQLVRFLQVSHKVIYDGLTRRGFPAAIANASAAFSVGRPGLALINAQNAELQNEHEKQIADLLSICQSPISRRLSAVSELTNKVEVSLLATTIDIWITVLRDALSVKTANDRYVSSTKSLPQLKSYTVGRSVNQIIASIRAAMTGKKLLAENINSRLIFENIVLSL